MTRFFSYIITAMVFFHSSAIAGKWTPGEMNEIIDQTNFVVNRGCSGTLISIQEKLILTNHHCIEDSISYHEQEHTDSTGMTKKVRIKRYADITVEQNGYSGHDKVSISSYITEIVSDSRKRDLAILRIKARIPHNLHSRILPDNTLIQRGERVYIVGNPAGNDATVVEGIISNLNRTFEFPWTGNEKLAMIQFSGGIYGGNSGGALYNSSGYLIGVPAAGIRSVPFIGLAIPISVVKEFLLESCLGNIYKEFDQAKCISDKKKKHKKEED